MHRTLPSFAFAAILAAPVCAQTADFSYQTLAPLVVQFNDTSSGGTATSWSWDFESDGVVDDGSQNPAWAYQAIGVYECTLTVGFGATTDTVTRSVFIEVLPVPEYGNTFSNSTRTRGFSFEAPTRFSIVAAEVPDETGHGQQNVAIYRLAGAPPVFPGAASGGLEFFAAGQPSGSPLPCAVSFDAGDWVGVLGACGDASIMHNSYSVLAGPQPSEVFGMPTTLTRLLTQTNIVTANGSGTYSEETNAQLSRVFLTLSRCVGVPYGDGTASSQANAPVLRTTQLPFLGSTAELTLENFDSNALGILAVGLGRLNVPTPVGTLLVDNLGGSVTLNGGALMNPGSFTFQFPVPNNAALQGFGPVNWQAATFVTGTAEFALSNGNEWFLELQ